MLPNATRVEQDRIGIVDVGRELIAVFAQAGDDQLAVELVHLAAYSFDVEFHAEGLRMRDAGSREKPSAAIPASGVPNPAHSDCLSRVAILLSAVVRSPPPIAAGVDLSLYVGY